MQKPDEKKSASEGARPRKGTFTTTIRYLGKPIMAVCDPVARVCVPAVKSHWERKYKQRYPRHATILLVLDMCLWFLVGALAVAAIFVKFIVPVLPPAGNVAVQIEAASPLVSGTTDTFTVSYRNDTGNAVADAVATVALPAWFVTDAPRNHEGLVEIPIGKIADSGNGSFTINGTPYAAVGKVLRAAARIDYWETANSSPSAAFAHLDLPVSSSVIGLVIAFDGPITRGQQTIAAITIENRGAETLHDAIVTLAMPADFVMLGSAPQQRSRGEWLIPDLAPGATRRIDVTGYLRATTFIFAPEKFLASVWKEDAGARRLLANTSADPQQIESGFEISQTVVSPMGVISAGGTFHLRFTYRNNGKHTLRHLKIALPLESPCHAFYWKSLEWDEASNPEFAALAPDATGTIDATSGILPDIAPTGPSNAVPILTFAPVATFVLDDAPTRTVYVDAPPVSIPLATTLAIDVRAAYYLAGDQVGRGPLPPKKGETTKLRVLLSVTNGVNASRGTVAQAYLPHGVEWTGRSSVTYGSALDFLPSSGRVRWEIGDLDAFAGRNGEPIIATFEVAVTPTSDDEAAIQALVKNIAIAGTDAHTLTRISGTAADVGIPRR